MGDRGVAPVVDLAAFRAQQAQRARRGAQIGRGAARRANPAAREPRAEPLPGYMVPEGTAVRLVELVDGDVVAVDADGRRTWWARIGFVADRWKVRRRPRRPLRAGDGAGDLLGEAA